MIKGGHGQTNQLHDINWGALDHAPGVLQLLLLCVSRDARSYTELYSTLCL